MPVRGGVRHGEHDGKLAAALIGLDHDALGDAPTTLLHLLAGLHGDVGIFGAGGHQLGVGLAAVDVGVLANGQNVVDVGVRDGRVEGQVFLLVEAAADPGVGRKRLQHLGFEACVRSVRVALAERDRDDARVAEVGTALTLVQANGDIAVIGNFARHGVVAQASVGGPGPLDRVLGETLGETFRETFRAQTTYINIL